MAPAQSSLATNVLMTPLGRRRREPAKSADISELGCRPARPMLPALSTDALSPGSTAVVTAAFDQMPLSSQALSKADGGVVLGRRGRRATSDNCVGNSAQPHSQIQRSATGNLPAREGRPAALPITESAPSPDSMLEKMPLTSPLPSQAEGGAASRRRRSISLDCIGNNALPRSQTSAPPAADPASPAVGNRGRRNSQALGDLKLREEELRDAKRRRDMRKLYRDYREGVKTGKFEEGWPTLRILVKTLFPLMNPRQVDGMIRWVEEELPAQREMQAVEAATVAENRALMASFFDALDTDASGAIELKEFLQLKLCCPALDLPDERLMEIYRGADMDGNGRLDFDEFCVLAEQYSLIELELPNHIPTPATLSRRRRRASVG